MTAIAIVRRLILHSTTGNGCLGGVRARGHRDVVAEVLIGYRGESEGDCEKIDPHEDGHSKRLVAAVGSLVQHYGKTSYWELICETEPKGFHVDAYFCVSILVPLSHAWVRRGDGRSTSCNVTSPLCVRRIATRRLLSHEFLRRPHQ